MRVASELCGPYLSFNEHSHERTSHVRTSHVKTLIYFFHCVRTRRRLTLFDHYFNRVVVTISPESLALAYALWNTLDKKKKETCQAGCAFGT